MWKRVKLCDFLEQRKEQVLIESDIEYSLVTISNRGEVKLREKKKGGLINAQKGYCVKAGDFIYSRLAVHTGAFKWIGDVFFTLRPRSLLLTSGTCHYRRYSLMETARAYEEVVNFIATQTARNSLIAFHPSEQAKERVMELIQKEKESGLATDEKSELDHYMQLEHLMRLAKARAKQYGTE